MKGLGVLILLFVVPVGLCSAYSFEVTAGAGAEIGYFWGLEKNSEETALGGEAVQLGLGFPLPVGKLYLASQVATLRDVSVCGSVGWGQEWAVSDWFSLEAAALATGGWVWTVYSLEPTEYIYAGIEPRLRANLLFWDGHIVLGLVSDLSVRWFQETSVQAALSVIPTLGLRF